MLPMEIYISGTRNAKETTSRFFMSAICCAAGFSFFCAGCACAARAPPQGWRHSPPFHRCCNSLWGKESSASTTMLFVRRFTVTFCTPCTLRTAFSTWAEQAEHVMPVTSYFCFASSPLHNPTPGVSTLSIPQNSSLSRGFSPGLPKEKATPAGHAGKHALYKGGPFSVTSFLHGCNRLLHPGFGLRRMLGLCPLRHLRAESRVILGQRHKRG